MFRFFPIAPLAEFLNETLVCVCVMNDCLTVHYLSNLSHGVHTPSKYFGSALGSNGASQLYNICRIIHFSFLLYFFNNIRMFISNVVPFVRVISYIKLGREYSIVPLGCIHPVGHLSPVFERYNLTNQPFVSNPQLL